MHSNNLHQSRYQFQELILANSNLKPFVFINKYGDETIDFSNPDAVKALNQSLLKHFYEIVYWDLPPHYLCPPIPGRADYIHTAADLFSSPINLRALDIGTGANCIYPLLASKIYNWRIIGTDIDRVSLENAKTIIDRNKLNPYVELRLQSQNEKIFRGVIHEGEHFDLTLCNPPFHESYAEAVSGTQRKWRNLKNKSNKKMLNFGGKSNELWCSGGEKSFILKMILESIQFKNQVTWFTTLVSKESTLPFIQKGFSQLPAKAEIKILEMTQGHKKSRLLAWTFKN